MPISQDAPVWAHRMEQDLRAEIDRAKVPATRLQGQLSQGTRAGQLVFVPDSSAGPELRYWDPSTPPGAWRSFSSASSGSYANLTVTSGLTLTGATVTGGTFVGGAFNGTVGATTPSTGAFTTLNSTSGALNGTLGATTPASATVTTFFSSGNATFGAAPPASGRLMAVSPALGISLALSDNTNNSLYVKHLANGATIGTDAGGAIALASNGFAVGVFVTSTQAVSLAGAPGSESLRTVPVASAVNRIEAYGSATTGSVNILAAGSDINVPLLFGSKGTSDIIFQTGGGIQAVARNTASSDRYITLTGGSGANCQFGASTGGLSITSALTFTNQTVGTTVGAAGGASAPPATPLGYLTLGLNAIGNVRIPYYN